MNIQEVIEQLKKSNVFGRVVNCIQCQKDINQVLIFLRKQFKCKVCKDTKKIRHDKCCGTGELSAGGHSNKCYDCDGTGKIPCPDCKQLEPNKFAKRIREETLQLQLYDSSDSRSPDITYTDVFKLCDIINQQAEHLADAIALIAELEGQPEFSEELQKWYESEIYRLEIAKQKYKAIIDRQAKEIAWEIGKVNFRDSQLRDERDENREQAVENKKLKEACTAAYEGLCTGNMEAEQKAIKLIDEVSKVQKGEHDDTQESNKENNPSFSSSFHIEFLS